MPSKPINATEATRPLLQALDQNDTVKEVVKQSADELLVVNAVLSHGLPDEVRTGDVAQALQNTEHIEDQIQASANDLAAVNRLLEHEIDERIDLERELIATKAALVRARAAPPRK